MPLNVDWSDIDSPHPVASQKHGDGTNRHENSLKYQKYSRSKNMCLNEKLKSNSIYPKHIQLSKTIKFHGFKRKSEI